MLASLQFIESLLLLRAQYHVALQLGRHLEASVSCIAEVLGALHDIARPQVLVQHTVCVCFVERIHVELGAVAVDDELLSKTFFKFLKELTADDVLLLMMMSEKLFVLSVSVLYLTCNDWVF